MIQMIFKNVLEFFRGMAPLSVDRDGVPTSHDLQVAAVALLIEMACVDDDFSAPEVESIAEILKVEFELNSVEVQDLIEIATYASGNPERVKDFIVSINDSFNSSQRQRILGLVWKVILSDGVVLQEETRLAMELRMKLNLTVEEAVRAQQIAVLD
ncbi:MAG: TerB family tellurite resistance protein [Bdellovibrionales bacterium]|nr:TerB family tellurite resistance protein [Bdellovibrionales bacterium]